MSEVILTTSKITMFSPCAFWLDEYRINRYHVFLKNVVLTELLACLVDI